MKLSNAGHLAASLAASLLALACGHEPTPARDLILISIDTLRADRLGCAGNPARPTPAIDALAARGIRFVDVTAPSPWTLPSHTSLLTGRSVASHGVRSDADRLSESLPTLAEALRAKGYRTGAFTDGGYLSSTFGLARGFDRYDDRQGTTAQIAGRALEWIDVGEKPFFVFLHTYDTHALHGGNRPYAATQADKRRFVPEWPKPDRLRGGLAVLEDILLDRFEPTRAELDALLGLYDAALAGVDRALGTFFHDLEQRGRLGDAVVSVVSDHGEGFLEHGLVVHAHALYEEFLQVPWVLAVPGGPEGVVVEEPATLVDVFPTLMAALGFDEPIPTDGVVRWPPDASGREHEGLEDPIRAEMSAENVAWVERMNRLGFRYEFRCLVAREGKLKLHWWPGSNRMELFDLERDPRESEDLSEKRPGDAARLRELAEKELRRAPVAPPRNVRSVPRLSRAD